MDSRARQVEQAKERSRLNESKEKAKRRLEETAGKRRLDSGSLGEFQETRRGQRAEAEAVQASGSGRDQGN